MNIKTLITAIKQFIPQPLPQTASELESTLVAALALAKFDIGDQDARLMVCNDIMRYEGHYRSIASLAKVLTRFRANQQAYMVIEAIREANSKAKAALETQGAAGAQKVDTSPV